MACVKFVTVLLACEAFLGWTQTTVSGAPGGKRVQLVAMPPNVGRRRKLNWALIAWENNTVNSELVARRVNTRKEVVRDFLGGFADLEFKYGSPKLACRLDKSQTRIICLGRHKITTPLFGGCCADSFFIYYKDGRDPQIVEVIETVRDELAKDDLSDIESRTVQITHSLSIDSEDSQGGFSAVVTIHYNSTALNGLSYGVVRIGLEAVAGRITDVGILPTAASKRAFLALRDIGTVSDDPADSIFRVQFVRGPAAGLAAGPVNGALRFVDMTGTPLLAITQKQELELIVLTDPWERESVDILQRFGTPPVLDAQTAEVLSYHAFGLDPSREGVLFGGIHNVWHTVYQNVETLTIFNNKADSGFARVYEIELKLAPREIGAQPTDAVFATPYRRVDLDYSPRSQGGARPIGIGLYVVSSGSRSEFVGLKVADSRGNIVTVEYSGTDAFNDGIYDPFVFIDVPDSEAADILKYG
uniref:Uncharacterized protein n=1 Tax=Tetraselmis sp. GSL018 TaxID=582737 RepID=A0A061S5R6_9CHLO|mmetsp:Transcript_42721/g.101418  ORF Transcript_42721/g.101418 Transcript_42721/m.101418 type:complete len:473 (+) Transcript_42721:106-1524(+)